jgi:murein DD-endopeptidase MepM/ murein hydrolase activator NlpD
MRPDKGGSQEYVYHLDEILPQDKPGKHVSAGEMIGYSGGQTSGGKHPTSSKWSTGPHIHFGLFDKYINTVVGSRPYGPSPVPLINQAKASNLTGFTGNGGDSTGTDTSSGTDTTSSTGISLADQVHQLLIEFPGFVGVAVALDQAEQFPGVKWYVNSSDPNPLNQVGDSIRSVLDTIVSNTLPLMLRSLFVAIGLLLLVGLLWNLVQSTGLADKAVNAAIGGMVAA